MTSDQGQITIHILPAGPIETNAYLLTERSRGEAILIDAPGEIWEQVEPIIREEQCRLVELWLTHGHWDHMQGAAEVVRATGAKVRAHPADRVMIETPEVMRSFLIPGIELELVKADMWFKPTETVAALGSPFEIRHVPGHCPGNVLFYVPTGTPFVVPQSGTKKGAPLIAASLAFVGDALFAGSVGRTDLPGGDFTVLERSIRTQIYTLPDKTLVFPGHGPVTTVGQEKRSNPYVAG